MGKTTPEEFKLFKSECLKWIDFFGLHDWRVDFSHEKIKGYACVTVNGLEDKVALFSFNTECDKHARKHLDIPKTAFHEVMELLLYPLFYIGTCRYVQPEEFYAARHSIIRTFENVIYPRIARKKTMAELLFPEKFSETEKEGI
jgi:hypothetical protein